jgi:phosphoenolpyruvate carboxykinase (GTP)
MGWVPRAGDVDLSGLHINEEDFHKATAINFDEWERELESQKEFFETFGDKVPRSMLLWREMLLARLSSRFKL